MSMNSGEAQNSIESLLIKEQECGCESTKIRLKKDEILEEMKKQLVLAGPLVTVNFLTFFLQVISLMYIGHLGELPLSGASVATSFASVTGFTFLRGVASALDTFCGQSYGAKQYHFLGIHMQRAMFVLLLLCVPLAFIWFNTAQILLFLGQDPEISFEAGRYARFMIPSIFAFAFQECHIRFLQSQNNVVAMMFISGITALNHVVFCWILVFKTGLGSKGAAIATAVSYWINALSLHAYVRNSRSCSKTWTGFSMEAFCGVHEFLKLAIPSAIMLSLEVWSFEMMVLLSGFLPNPKLETSVLSISLNTCSMVYMIPLGLSAAISIRVSNELGTGRPHSARLAVVVSMMMVMAEAIVAGSAMISGRKYWAHLYTKDDKIADYVGEMLLIISVSHFFDGIQSVLSGTARGCGWQKICALINLGAYYLIGIPSGIILSFVYHKGGQGLWIGIALALLVQSLSLLIKTLCTDWPKQAKRAADRLEMNRQYYDSRYV